MKPRTFLLSLSLFLWGCDSTNTTAGTNDETTTTVATILRPDGRPAAGARVLVYAAGDTQSAPVGSGRVDEQGRVALVSAPKAGWYNLLVKDDSGRAVFEDSLVSDGHRLTVLDDTLRRTARVTGRVRVQPQDKPTIAWVQLLGAGRYSNLDDSGRFVFDSVPAGRMTLAALTLVPQYTPTFRAVHTYPDSTLDAGTITLVYTGIPQVQKVSVRWDSVANTATVTWDAVADTMVDGYTVYRTTQTNPGTFSPVAYVDAGTSWIDTLFGANGSLGKPLDSVRLTVRYQVIASTYLGNGPASRSDSAVVRSPLLVGSWNPDWARGTLPQGADPASIDSLAGGLAVIAYGDSGTATLWTSADGAIWTRSISFATFSTDFVDDDYGRHNLQTSQPRFWKGRMVWCTARTSGRTFRHYARGSFSAIDSLVVHRFDGTSQDSTALKVHGDSVAFAVLVPARDTLALFEQIGGSSACYNQDYWIGAAWKSTDARTWVEDRDNTVAPWFRLQPGSGGTPPGQLLTWSAPELFFSRSVQSICITTDSATLWPAASGPTRTNTSGWGFTPPEGASFWGIPGATAITGRDSLIVTLNANAATLRWASTANPSGQHRIVAPAGNLRIVQVWRGKLWTSDGTTLWSAPLP